MFCFCKLTTFRLSGAADISGLQYFLYEFRKMHQKATLHPFNKNLRGLNLSAAASAQQSAHCALQSSVYLSQVQTEEQVKPLKKFGFPMMSKLFKIVDYIKFKKTRGPRLDPFHLARFPMYYYLKLR